MKSVRGPLELNIFKNCITEICSQNFSYPFLAMKPSSLAEMV